MADISLEAVTGKLNRVGYEAFIQALRQAKSAGNRNLELAHWLGHILQNERSDITLTADHFKLDRAKLLMDLGDAIGGLRANQTEMPEISDQVQDVLDGGWYYATLFFGETQIRTGHLLVGAFKKSELRRALAGLSREFGKINVDTLSDRAPHDLAQFGGGKSAPDGRLGSARAPARPAPRTRPGRAAPPRSTGSRRISPRRRRRARWTRSSGATRRSGRSSTC